MEEIEKVKKPKKKKEKIDWEGKFFEQVQELGMRIPARQYQAIPRRKYKFDFAWVYNVGPDVKMVVAEIEGGTWGSSSRHTSGAGFKGDCLKYNLATSLGWHIYRFTSDMVKDKSAVEFMKGVLDGKVEG